MISTLIISWKNRNEPLKLAIDESQSLLIDNNPDKAVFCFKEGIFSKIILNYDGVFPLDQKFFFQLHLILKNGGLLHFLNPTSDHLNVKLLIAGFVSTNPENDSAPQYKKPEWAGKTASLNKNKVNNQPVKVSVNQDTQIPSKTSKAVLGMFSYESLVKTVDDYNPRALNGEKSKFIDEDKLLENEVGYSKLAKEENCSTKPKACKNCSCGRNN